MSKRIYEPTADKHSGGYFSIASFSHRILASLTFQVITIAHLTIRGTSSPDARVNSRQLSRLSNAIRLSIRSYITFLALISDVLWSITEGTDGTEVAGLTPHRPLAVLYLNGTCLSWCGNTLAQGGRGYDRSVTVRPVLFCLN